MFINIIVAYCKNNGIGLNNNMPWKIKSDLQKFKSLTTGNGNNAIVMGKNTFLSLNCNPLNKRDNLILSSTLNIDKLNNNSNITKSFKNIEILKDFVNTKSYDTLWIIGGEKIYKLFLESNIFEINNIYVTYINNDYKCDTFFPIIDTNNFHFISKSIHESQNNDLNIYDMIYKS
tara:strand:- start:1334 stop:1858 length:525 start_codon:yes stop_codon:yes gene_type:complete